MIWSVYSLPSILSSDTCVIRHDFWNISRGGSENSYYNMRNLYSPSLSLTSYVSSFHYPIFFGRDWTHYSVYSINRDRKLASGYTLDLGQLEIHSNDYFENWAYPELNPAFVPSANFQLAIPPVENTEFPLSYLILFYFSLFLIVFMNYCIIKHKCCSF